jgi:hypothetical protein
LPRRRVAPPRGAGLHRRRRAPAAAAAAAACAPACRAAAMHGAMQARARDEVVVIDNGGCTIKAGLASAPSGVRCATPHENPHAQTREAR